MAILGKIDRGLAIIEKRPGPLETGDLGENGDFGENWQRAGDNRKTSRRKSPEGRACDIQNVANI